MKELEKLTNDDLIDTINAIIIELEKDAGCNEYNNLMKTKRNFLLNKIRLLANKPVFIIGNKVVYKYDLNSETNDKKGYDKLLGKSILTIKNIYTDVYENTYLQFEEVIDGRDEDSFYDSTYFKLTV